MILKRFPEDFIVEEIPLFDFSSNGEYTYFLLEKKSYNTEDAVIAISKKFNIPRNLFSYAGNKDKNAVTKQYVSVRGNIKDTEFKDIKIKIIGKGKNPISLGDLKGNKFEITVRDIEKKPKKIIEFPNYFDEQRFGRNNLKIGLAIIKKKFKEAANFLDYPIVKEHMSKFPNDYIGAIRKVPFKTLKLFIHSVQSYLWNHALTSCLDENKNVKIESENFIMIIPQGKIKNISLPLITFDTEFDDFSKKCYEKILAETGIDIRDFIIRAMPDITPKGTSREIMAYVKDLEIGELKKDEISGKKKIILKFTLNKGCYATIFVKCLFAK